MTELDEIWADDLLDRRDEAARLIRFMESVYSHRTKREDASAYVVAVDGEYGQGKSYFLRRLARELELSHPVAFVDAWADDLADQPFVALAATLRRALEPYLKNPKVSQRWAEFAAKAGKVAKLAAGGALKRGLGLILTAGVVDQISGTVSGASEAVQDATKDVSTDIGARAIQDSLDGLKSIAPARLLAGEIAAFEARKEAVAGMKESLAALVASLREDGAAPPIFIVIDELDRCRPTYAVKLLEEVKHLFDVEGLVFVFGLHGSQLAHSVVGAYGPGFDGAAYLRRFFHRRFLLTEAKLGKLVDKLIRETGLSSPSLFADQRIGYGEGRSQPILAGTLITLYMHLYELGARDAFEMIDRIVVCVGLTEAPLVASLLLPMLCNDIKGRNPLSLDTPQGPPPWNYTVYDAGRERTQMSPQKLFSLTVSALTVDLASLSANSARGIANPGEELVAQSFGNQHKFDQLPSYGELLRAVDQFRNPSLSEE